MEASAFREAAALPWQLQAAEGDPRGGEALAPDSLRESAGEGRLAAKATTGVGRHQGPGWAGCFGEVVRME